MQMSHLTLLIRNDNKAIQTKISIRYQRQKADTRDNSPAVMRYQKFTLHIFAGENFNTLVLSFEFFLILLLAVLLVANLTKMLHPSTSMAKKFTKLLFLAKSFSE